jgi:DNA-directed RNA polymerase specialized sigma24 family protein
MRSWTDVSDEALLARAVRERAAFAVFYERHERDVLGFFGAVTRRPESAADLTAETFAAALDGVARFDPERGSARMWLFGIARNDVSGASSSGA